MNYARPHFFTIPTFAALKIRSPIFQPVYIVTATSPFSNSLSVTVKTASWSFGSNFCPLGSYYSKLNLNNTLSITLAVIYWPSKFAKNLSFIIYKSVSYYIYSFSEFSSANLTASLTSSKSFANLVIANYFSSSIIFRYLLTVSSFSRTYFVYSILNNCISLSPFSRFTFSSSSYFFIDSISASYSANNYLIFLMSSFVRSSDTGSYSSTYYSFWFVFGFSDAVSFAESYFLSSDYFSVLLFFLWLKKDLIDYY